MANDFNELRQAFERILEGVAQNCNALGSLPGGGGERRTKKWEEVSDALKEADSLIRKMDLEARTQSAGERAGLLGQLREKKLELNAAKRMFRSFASSEAEDGDIEAGSDASTYADQRSKLLQGVERLASSGSRIAESRKSLLQTEGIGAGILQDLHQQRHTLIRSHEMLHAVDADVSRSRQILNMMTQKMHRNKWITALILCILFAAIALVIFLKLKAGS